MKTGKRNTPSLHDVRLNRWFGWSGGGDSLWMQSIRPILDPGEMGASARHVQRYIGSHPELSGGYAGVFGRDAATADPDAVLVDAAKALAAYQETIVTEQTPFDAYRDALAAGDEAAAARYPVAARRGLAVFIGKGGCNACHAGPAFTDGSFRVLGSTANLGRAQTMAGFLTSPFNRAGPFNDDPKREVPWRAEALGGERGYRVPTLRNVARTAPYLHDGSASTWRDAIRGHGKRGRTLTRGEVADLVRFLETLSEAGPSAK